MADSSNLSAATEIMKQSQQPSLLDLSLKNALEQVLNPDFPYHEFEKLEPPFPRLLFAKMRSELVRLQEFERKFNDTVPHIDAKLCVEKELFTSEDDQDLLDYWREEWSYTEPDGYRDPHFHPESCSWEDWELVSASPGSDLVVDQKASENSHAVRDRISSQLLLYRLCVIFGTPPYYPPNVRVWNAMLYHKDGTSRLLLYEDHKELWVDYEGLRETSDLALKLLNFLCGMSIPDVEGAVAGVSTRT